MTQLQVEDVRQQFGALTVLNGITVTVPPGQALGVVGPNGAGKTTLLDIVAGGRRPTGGQVRLAGQDVTTASAAHRTRLGLGRTYQVSRPFASMTVFENALVAAARGAALRTHRAGLLSGGEQQAVAIARALAANPRVLLLDEVSLGLAPAIVDSFYQTLPTIQASGVSILVVEQDIDRALAASARTLCLLEGRVVLSGPSGSLDRAALIAAYFGAPAGPPSAGPPNSGPPNSGPAVRA